MDYNLLFAVVVQLGTIAVFAGIGWTRLVHLEKETDDLRGEVRDFRALKEDLAVVKSQLANISTALNKLAVDQSARHASYKDEE